MSTFAGSYIQEPADLQSVCTEADIIACCDDTGAARDYTTFATLPTAPTNVRALIVGVANALIEPVESLIESYARRRGYALPLAPLDADVKDIAARLMWISLRQRGKSLTSVAAEQERKLIRDNQLTDIASGKLILTAALSAATTPPPASYVDTVSSGNERSDGVVRASRASMRRF